LTLYSSEDQVTPQPTPHFTQGQIDALSFCDTLRLQHLQRGIENLKLALDAFEVWLLLWSVACPRQSSTSHQLVQLA
jgi:hypothetical protein